MKCEYKVKAYLLLAKKIKFNFCSADSNTVRAARCYCPTYWEYSRKLFWTAIPYV